MKYLIVGLGNIGDEYCHTRHNIGFDIVDQLALDTKIDFDLNCRYGAVAQGRIKNKLVVLLKPSTYMNNSGKAIRYWLEKEKIPIQNMLVVVDDISLEIGTIRFKKKGSDAGHNGLKSIEYMLGTQNYSRLRFGIGNNFAQGSQVNFVLSCFDSKEREIVDEKITTAAEGIRSFCLQGIDTTMNFFNNK